MTAWLFAIFDTTRGDLSVKKIFALLLVFALVMTFIPSFAGAQSQNERIIILFKTKADKNLVTLNKGKVNREYKNIAALAATVPTVAIKGIQKNPNVAAVEVDKKIQINSQTVDWGISRTEAPKAWESQLTGKGIKVAVIDSGIANHEDLVISGGASFVSYTNSYHDDNGHGTHVAGIIGAKNNAIGTVGIAPDSSIYAVKSLDQNGSGYLSDIVAGVDWSIQNNMDIVNMSLGTTTHSSTLQQIVDTAYNKNILVVAAAGNNGTSDGSGDSVNYPARYSSAIAVSATDSSDNRASFSATGATIEVAAPGVGIASTYINNSYARMNGTSMAAPYAAGNLALMKQADSTLSAEALRMQLQQRTIDLGPIGKDNWFGYGLIQAPVAQQEASPVEETVVAETSTTVSVNKGSYKAGETVYITMTAYDKDNRVLPNANAKVVVVSPVSTETVYQGVTNSKGQFTVAYKTARFTSLKGTYRVQAETTKAGYKISMGKTSFQVK